MDVLANHWTIQEEMAAQHGKVADRSKWRLVGLMHIAETEAQARAEVENGIEQSNQVASGWPKHRSTPVRLMWPCEDHHHHWGLGRYSIGCRKIPAEMRSRRKIASAALVFLPFVGSGCSVNTLAEGAEQDISNCMSGSGGVVAREMETRIEDGVLHVDSVSYIRSGSGSSDEVFIQCFRSVAKDMGLEVGSTIIPLRP